MLESPRLIFWTFARGLTSAARSAFSLKVPRA